MAKIGNKGLAGGVGAVVTTAGTWLVGTFGELGAWALSTEQIWFPLVSAYNRFVAPKFGAFPKLGPIFLGLFVLYAIGRIIDLGDSEDEIQD
jgi:hypothetical protein